MKGLLNFKGPSISEQLSVSKQKEMYNARIALETIFSTTCLLARHSIALRGHDEQNSNLNQFLQCRAEDISELNEWLQRSGNKWIHHDVIDEILKIMSHEVTLKIMEKIKTSGFYAIIADEASDSFRKEQFSFSLRTVGNDLTIEENFLGFYETSDTESETLYKVIKDIFLRLQLNISKLRGQCYDGASNMSGEISGLQKRIRDDEPTALYVHCRPHTLNLVVQDSMEIEKK